MVEAGFLWKKTNKGFYDYSKPETPQPKKDEKLGKEIFTRIIAMLINEAIDALYMQIGSKEDIDTAMTKGVNYPKGLLKWCDELGAETILQTLTKLHADYGRRPLPPKYFIEKSSYRQQEILLTTFTA